MEFTIVLSEKQIEQLNTIASTRRNKTMNQLIDQVVERGLYTLVQRSKYNSERYESLKGEREEFKQWKESMKVGK